MFTPRFVTVVLLALAAPCTVRGQCTTNLDCDDANQCTADVCSSGTCVNDALADGSGCDLGLECTVDVCVSGACVIDHVIAGCPASPTMGDGGPADRDGDGLVGAKDNCSELPNGPQLGTCQYSLDVCMSDSDCPSGEPCSMDQEDMDEDGIGDVCDEDRDGDGRDNDVDECPDNPLKRRTGACGCNMLDFDSDQDGVADCVDPCPADPDKQAPGECGCGVPDDDDDLDGVVNCLDACPGDPLKQEPGECGCRALDADADGVDDCADPCPHDNPDDANNNGVCDSMEVSSDVDEDVADKEDMELEQPMSPTSPEPCGLPPGPLGIMLIGLLHVRSTSGRRRGRN